MNFTASLLKVDYQGHASVTPTFAEKASSGPGESPVVRLGRLQIDLFADFFVSEVAALSTVRGPALEQTQGVKGGVRQVKKVLFAQDVVVGRGKDRGSRIARMELVANGGRRGFSCG